MKRILFALLVVILVSCHEAPNTEKTMLLTNTTWEPEQWLLFNGEMSNYHYPVKFLPDGKYALGESGETLNGKWRWIAENQIELTIESITNDGSVIDFPTATITHLFVKKLTKTEFRYIVDGKDTFFKEDEEVNLIALN